ncbi:hypothetical protein QTP86_030584, partial [Hemibagrus guttatus]
MKHKDTIMVVETAPVILKLFPVDDTEIVQQSSDYDAVSTSESIASFTDLSSGSSSSQNTIILSPLNNSSPGQKGFQFHSLHMKQRCALKEPLKPTRKMEHLKLPQRLYHFFLRFLAPKNPSINMIRDLLIRCLMEYLGESPDQLFKELIIMLKFHRVLQDIATQKMKIYVTKNIMSEEPSC